MERITGAHGRAMTLAAFYTAGGVLTVLLALGAPSGTVRTAVGAIAAAALVAGAAVALTGRRLGALVCHALVVAGTALISGVVWQLTGADGGLAMTAAVMYVFPVVYAAGFFSRAATLAHLGVVGVGLTAALAASAAAPHAYLQVPVVMGAVAVTGAVARRLVERIRELAEQDPLTGAANRLVLPTALTGATHRSPDAPGGSVIAFDLDHFKQLNDTRGHAAGDDLLREVARQWRAHIRAADTLVRLGGDEFVVVLPDCDAQRAELVARQATAATADTVTSSVGIACRLRGEPVERTVARADRALYRAKALGGGAIVVDDEIVIDDETAELPTPQAN